MSNDTLFGYPVKMVESSLPAMKIVVGAFPQSAILRGRCPYCGQDSEFYGVLPDRVTFEQVDELEVICGQGHEFKVTITRKG